MATAVRMWDLLTRRPVGDPLTGYTGAVYVVSAMALPDGRAVAVSGGGDNSVQVWDLARGSRLVAR